MWSPQSAHRTLRADILAARLLSADMLAARRLSCSTQRCTLFSNAVRSSVMRPSARPSAMYRRAASDASGDDAASMAVPAHVAVPTGFVAGVLGSLCGIGGGAVIIPALSNLTQLAPKAISAASLFCVSVRAPRRRAAPCAIHPSVRPCVRASHRTALRPSLPMPTPTRRQRRLPVKARSLRAGRSVGRTICCCPAERRPLPREVITRAFFSVFAVVVIFFFFLFFRWPR